MTILLLLVGLGLVVLGADWLVEGASAIARKAGVSEFVIGLTIVGFGTSCPELVVSLTGAIEGNADIAVGNVIGSNIFNTLFILGLTALLCPVGMTQMNRKHDIPQLASATVLFLAFGMNHTFLSIGHDDSLTRLEGVLFVTAFVAYLFHCLRRDKDADKEDADGKQRKLAVAVLLVTIGLAGLILGGNLFVNSATDLARRLGVSDKFIAVTLLAGGTSLPELATSLVAVLKGRNQLALGNIIGSNIFNLLLILGGSALITPLSFASVNYVDACALLLSALLLLLFAYTGKRERIDRWEGAVMLVLFGAYYFFLFKQL